MPNRPVYRASLDLPTNVIGRSNAILRNQPVSNSADDGYEPARLAEIHSLMSQNLLPYNEIRFLENGEYMINRRLINQRLADRQAAEQVESIDEILESDYWASESEPDDEPEPSSFDDDDDDEDMSPTWKTIKPNDFPTYEIPTWSSADEREKVTDLYFKQVEYRLRWIFFREEREGFRRRSHGVQPFSRQDFLDKIAKKEVEHELNTAESTFYDWNIGATDFILRFENFEVDEVDAMRIHFIYKGNRLEVGYQDRIWDGRHYQEVTQQWAEIN